MNHRSLNLKIKAYKPLRKEIYNSLRNAIIKGEIRSGMRFVETHIAKQLGVSRTPVREAFHKLELEGLLLAHPNKGLIVSEISIEDIEEIVGIRMILESYAARLATKRIKNKDIDELEGILNKSEKHIKKGEINKVLKLNTSFHNLINSISGSKRLQEMIYQLQESILRYRRAALYTKGYAEKALKEHRLILVALKKRNPRSAEVRVSQHISENKKIVLKSIR